MANRKNAAGEAAPANPVDTAAVFGDHFPTLIGILANRLTRGASSYYRHTYGVGVIEWRVLYALQQSGDLSASEIAAVTDLDKAAVSRSIRVLEHRGLVRIIRTGKADRRIIPVVTAAGRKLQHDLHAVAQERQKTFMQDFTPAEIDEFRTMIARVLARVPRSAAGAARAATQKGRRSRAVNGGDAEAFATTPPGPKAKSRAPATRDEHGDRRPPSRLGPRRAGDGADPAG
jgi:DNA-binding MarR family transcriptional regulator